MIKKARKPAFSTLFLHVSWPPACFSATTRRVNQDSSKSWVKETHGVSRWNRKDKDREIVVESKKEKEEKTRPT